MIQNSHRSRRVRAHRAGGVIAAVGVALGALVVTASAASADQSCRSGVGYVNCIDITQSAIIPPSYRVHFGIDVHMSRQDAEAILAGGGGFSATLMGDDYWYDNALKIVPVTWQAAGDGSLSAEFDTDVPRSLLNEDWDGRDEVYGRIRLYDPRTRTTSTFTTNVLYFNF